MTNNTTLLVGGEPLHTDDQSTIRIAKANSVSKALAFKSYPRNSVSSSAKFDNKENISTRSAKILPKAHSRTSASMSNKSQRKGVFPPETRRIMEVIYRM